MANNHFEHLNPRTKKTINPKIYLGKVFRTLGLLACAANGARRLGCLINAFSNCCAGSCLKQSFE